MTSTNTALKPRVRAWVAQDGETVESSHLDELQKRFGDGLTIRRGRKGQVEIIAHDERDKAALDEIMIACGAGTFKEQCIYE